MTVPTGLILGLLTFWGWQSQFLVVGVLMGLVLEGARFTDSRWDFNEKDLRRFWNLCTLLFLGATLFSFISNEGAGGLVGLLQGSGANSRAEALNATTRSVLDLLKWLPMVFFPMILAQAYGTTQKMDLRVFSWVLRQRHAKNPELPPPPTVNMGYPYSILVLGSASTANAYRELFFFGLVAMVGWVLWRNRNRRFSIATWVVVLMLAGAFGFAGQLGLRQLQKVLQRLDASWLASRVPDIDRSNTLTEMGSVGRLKMSNRIILRVDPEKGPVPELLREASYNEFASPNRWFVAKRVSQDIFPENDSEWPPLVDKPLPRSLWISRSMGRRGSGLLALPPGVGELDELRAFRARTNGMGNFKVLDGPGVLRYRSLYGPGKTMDRAPEPSDLFLPGVESNAVMQVANEISLASSDPEEVLRKVKRLFTDHFEYSTYLERENEEMTPLAEFLIDRRTGHCEYFAAASVFLLRAGGIPARYAVGFSVQERKGDRYIVRGRHAHAWCLAYVDGQWVDFDGTPPSWHDVESHKANFWEPISDFFSNLWFSFSLWRWSEPGIQKYLPWMLAPPVGFILFRLISGRQRRRLRVRPGDGGLLNEWPGADSEMYAVMDSLAKRGLGREDKEPVLRWLERIKEIDPSLTGPLDELGRLHYRYRFDPDGVSDDERTALREKSELLLDR